MTPLEAATHADPYDYCSRLRRTGGLLFDAELGLSVASTAQLLRLFWLTRIVEYARITSRCLLRLRKARQARYCPLDADE